MSKRKIERIQIGDGQTEVIHCFQISNCEMSLSIDSIYGNCIIGEKELLLYLQSRNSQNNIERNDSAAGKKPTVSLPYGEHNTRSPKYPKFENFWKSVPDPRGSVGIMSYNHVKKWSKTVFEQSRL